ncbi:MAG: hypothetical protein OEM52_02805 [bacterium]|nr:hypothetical protein [bacterium]
MRKLLFILFLFCLTANSIAQLAQVSGSVLRDGVSGIPFAWVEYTHTGTGTIYNIQCDNTGRYDISDLVLPVTEQDRKLLPSPLPVVATNQGGSSHNFYLAASSMFRVASVYDVLGRKTAEIRLQNRQLAPILWIAEGYWDGKAISGQPVASGVYFLSLGSNYPVTKLLHNAHGIATSPQSSQFSSAFQYRSQSANRFRDVKQSNTIQLESEYSIRVFPDSICRPFFSRTFLRTLHDATINIVIDTVSAPPPQRILFLGNSYTYYNNGVDVHLNMFVQAADTALHPVIESITGGGYTLQMHYNTTTTQQQIATGDYDIVILQEQSTRPVEEPAPMIQYGRSLQLLAANSGAETGLFMTWARQNNPPMITPLQQAYDSLGHLVNALVSPVGLAFEEVRTTMPTMNLYDTDGSHPSVYGTYLAVCVFYASLWNRSPIGVNYVCDPSITDTEKTFLQTTAWSVVQNYRHQHLRN